jgi:hypothetical protein
LLRRTQFDEGLAQLIEPDQRLAERPADHGDVAARLRVHRIRRENQRLEIQCLTRGVRRASEIRRFRRDRPRRDTSSWTASAGSTR